MQKYGPMTAGQVAADPSKIETSDLFTGQHLPRMPLKLAHTMLGERVNDGRMMGSLAAHFSLLPAVNSSQ